MLFSPLAGRGIFRRKKIASDGFFMVARNGWSHQDCWLVVLTCFNHLEKYEFVNGVGMTSHI